MTSNSNPELTKREREVVLELLKGGRISTIAEVFGVSPRTIGNHLKSSFWKLGVHSQTQLIELARSAPGRLGLTEGEITPERRAIGELEKACQQARDRLISRVEAAYVGPPSLSQLRAAVREALPLDPERRQDWRNWLELRARSNAEGASAGDPQQGIDEWRDSNVNRVSRLQEAGLIRDDLDPKELLATIGALALGMGTRLLGSPSETSTNKELQMLKTFVDSLAPRPRS